MEFWQRREKNRQYRLPGYDYSSFGVYFVTICTKDGEGFFGEIRKGVMGLNEIGCATAKFYQEIPTHFKQVTLSQWQIMPNHFHGIIEITGNGVTPAVPVPVPVPVAVVGPSHGMALQQRAFGKTIPGSLSSIVNQFKGAVTRWCRGNGYKNFAWQPRFHDHIVRSEAEWGRIRDYIRDNPLKWEKGRNRPLDENDWQ